MHFPQIKFIFSFVWSISVLVRWNRQKNSIYRQTTPTSISYSTNLILIRWKITCNVSLLKSHLKLYHWTFHLIVVNISENLCIFRKIRIAIWIHVEECEMNSHRRADSSIDAIAEISRDIFKFRLFRPCTRKYRQSICNSKTIHIYNIYFVSFRSQYEFVFPFGWAENSLSKKRGTYNRLNAKRYAKCVPNECENVNLPIAQLAEKKCPDYFTDAI